jgi:hypothetical protein
MLDDSCKYINFDFFPARNDYGDKTDVAKWWSLIKSELISVPVS